MKLKLDEKLVREFANSKGKKTKSMLLIKSHTPGEHDKILTKANAKKMVESGLFEMEVHV